jgi:AcrR family transcriptional regulator
VTTKRNESARHVSLPGLPRPRRQQLPLPPPHTSNRKPRDHVHQAVLQATIDLVDNPRIGYAGLTMEAIARRAHVSKGTLYRWWPSKAHLLLDAYLAKAHRDVPTSDTGDLATDLQDHFGHIAYALTHLGTGRTLAEIIVAANADPAFAELFRSTLLNDRKTSSRLILERARARGEIRNDADLDVAIDAAYGAIHHRLLVSSAPIDDPYVGELTQLIVHGLTVRQH